ncbi:hypothetical protein GJ496_000015 [Pomphorhynchus laevis]|nr:hypothetical protein GJ496_000015 [Pomphorhynchus laevis]
MKRDISFVLAWTFQCASEDRASRAQVRLDARSITGLIANITILCATIYYSDSPCRWRSLIGIFTCFTVAILISENLFSINFGVINRAFLVYQIISYCFVHVSSFQHQILRFAFVLIGSSNARFTGFNTLFGNVSKSYLIDISISLIVQGAFVNLFYHLGIMQIVISSVGNIISFLIGTSPIESFIATTHIFFGIAESSIAIKPFIAFLTPSELTMMMTSSFASTALTLWSSLIAIQIPPYDILRASVSTLPCSIVFAKILYPEIFKTRATRQMIKCSRHGHSNNISAFEAFLKGAVSSLSICATLFVCILVINTTLYWLDDIISNMFILINLENISFQILLSYTFYPFAYAMGVPKRDLQEVSRLIGIKTIFSEAIAFQKLSKIIILRENLPPQNINRYICGIEEFVNPEMKHMIFHKRSLAIVISALTGFANMNSLSSMIGVLSAIAPKRMSTVRKQIGKSLCCAAMVNIMNGIMAGLYSASDDEKLDCLSIANMTTIEMDKILM